MERNDAITILKVLKANCSKYFPEHQALDYAISFLENYENHLNNDMVAMLTEIQLEIEKKEHHYQDKFLEPKNAVHNADMCGRMFGCGECKEIIQQRIDAMRKINHE